MTPDVRTDWSLVVFSLLLPTSLCIFLSASLLPVEADAVRRSALALSWAAIAAGLCLLPFHLGRPAKALLGLSNQRSSWLAREASLTLAFAVLLMIHVVEPFVAAKMVFRGGMMAITAALGVLALVASVKTYSVPGRPAWQFQQTLIRFMGGGVNVSLLAMLTLSAGATGRIDESILEIWALWLRWGTLGALCLILVEWLSLKLSGPSSSKRGYVSRNALARDTEARMIQMGGYLSMLTVILLAIAGFVRADTLLYLIAWSSYALASWFFRLAFFSRGIPLEVRRLAEAVRQRRVQRALLPMESLAHPSEVSMSRLEK